jgi:hypothetical protein
MPRSNQRSITTTTTLQRASLALILLALHQQHQNQSWSSGSNSVHALSSIAVGGTTTRTITVTADVPERNCILLDEAVTNDRTTLGNLIVPHVGIGTIAWSTDNGACGSIDPQKDFSL